MEKVFVIGASSFLGLHCVNELIKSKYYVKASYRSQKNKKIIIDNIGDIDCINKKLEICHLDLDLDSGWKKNLEGCDYLIHIPSPNPLKYNSEESLVKDIVDQVERSIVNSISSNIKKLILISSQATISYGQSKKEYNEKSWSDDNNKNLNLYIRSRTKAEKIIWKKINSIYKNKIDFCTLNSGFIIGPVLDKSSKSPSVNKIKNILAYKISILPKRYVNCIDVRDLAKLCAATLKCNKINGVRFPCMQRNPVSFNDLCKILKNNKFNITTITLPNYMLSLFGKFNKRMKQIRYLATKKNIIDNSITIDLLDWKQTPVEKSIVDMANSIIINKKI